MTITALFWKRLIGGWRSSYHAWRLVFDWSVQVYLGIPILIAVVYNYAKLWNAPPAWLQYFQLGGVFLAFFLICCVGQLRTFLEYGDQLFLRQKGAWIRGLKARGIAYSLWMAIVRVLLVAILLLPIIYESNVMSFTQLSVLIVISVVCNTYVLAGKVAIEQRYVRIKRFFAMLMLYIAVAFVLFAIVLSLIEQPFMLMALSLVAVLPLYNVLLKLIGNETNFVSDVQREQKIRTKSLTLIMGQTGLIKKEGWFTLEAPIIFRESKQLFKKRTPVNVLVEQCIKTFFRKWSLITVYMQYISIILFAIIFVPPLWLKGTIWVAGFILTMLWLKTYWKAFRKSDFVAMFNWDFRVLMDAETKATYLLALPAYTFITLISVIVILI